ncbi:MAG TPA: hypothetical protein VJS44_04710 [Pyrinomonadaceae bacterium]|nr:hypothetical protein [Pyrinomonadaceae bacterium]
MATGEKDIRGAGRQWLRSNLMGHRFGDLIPLYPVRYTVEGGWYWLMLCVRRRDGQPCYRTREVSAKYRLNTRACAGCTGQAKPHNYPRRKLIIVEAKKVEVTRKNVDELRSQFSPAQQARYRQIMGSRPDEGEEGLINKREAVEMVLLGMDR